MRAVAAPAAYFATLFNCTGDVMKSKTSNLWQTTRKVQSDEAGSVLVEFAILMPMLLLVFAVIIEGGRLMWSYQTVIAGVRDASRYLARTTPEDICNSGGSVAGATSALEDIVRQSIDGVSLFPSGITVNSVTPTLSCVVGSYRVSPAPIAQVSASLTVTFPFSGLFSFAGQSLGQITTTIRDQSRIFGT